MCPYMFCTYVAVPMFKPPVVVGMFGFGAGISNSVKRTDRASSASKSGMLGTSNALNGVSRS